MFRLTPLLISHNIKNFVFAFRIIVSVWLTPLSISPEMKIYVISRKTDVSDGFLGFFVVFENEILLKY